MKNQRCGFVAVIGPPNAGKSTLVNALVGSKITIVSPKVQTTRTRVLGIVIEDKSQMVFIDTPGIFRPRDQRRLEKAIVAAAWQGVADADIILIMVDASVRFPERSIADILDGLKKDDDRRPCFLVLNKIDLVRKHELLALAQRMNGAYAFEGVFMISAGQEDGVQDIVKTLAKRLPESEWIFPEDQISTMPSRLLAAEIVREKLFRKLHEELPYALTVETEQWEEREDGLIEIHQTIFVTRDSHKAIVLGKGGSMIKSVGEEARIELEEIFESRIHLQLFVKVKENWMDDPERYALWDLDLRK